MYAQLWRRLWPAAVLVLVVACSPAQLPGQSMAVSTPSPTPVASLATASPTATPTAAGGSETPTPSPASTAADGTMTGTWDGTWVNDPQFGDPPASGGFTVQLEQTGGTFNGTVDVTGDTCVGHGDVDGSVTGSHVHFGWISDAAEPVNFEGTLNGGSMSGTWSAIACGTTDYTVTGTWQATKR